MSRPAIDGTDAVRFDTDEPSGDESDWDRRHGRLDRPETDRCVRPTAPPDDWDPRHAMTGR